MAFGYTLAVCAIGLVACSLPEVRAFTNYGPAPIVFAWVLASAVYFITKLSTRPSASSGAALSIAVASDGDAPRARALAVKSIAAPLFGIIMMTPLSLHAALGFAFSFDLDGFEDWVLFSAILTTHVHLVMAAYGVRFARIVVEQRDQLEVKVPRYSPASHGAIAATLAATAALIPGAVLLLIPPIVVMLTGLFFAPFVFHLVAASYTREEDALVARA